MKKDKIHTPRVSVVIPMYNCEEFVQGVLRMFSDQRFTDYEVICIVDGATDGTEEEVIKYCETDDRFRYVVRVNGGAGAARNTGMNLAKGKYIVFSDADDEYSKDYLRKLYEAAEKNDAEIAVCGAITFDYMKEEKGRTIGFSKNSLLEGRLYSAKKTKRLISKIDVQISNKMILLDFIKKHGLKFSETRASNDVFFSIALTACAERIVVIHDDLIKIRRFINPHSISSSRGKYSQIALMEIQKLYHWMHERDLLKYYLSDYLYWMDGALNYEMKNSVNPLLAKEMAHILNCDEPWIKIKSSQVIQILTNSLGDKGAEQILKPEQNTDDDEIKRLQNRNNIVKERNENRCRMQELIKKESIEIYDRDLDDPESISPVFAEYIKKREALYSNQDHCDSLREVQVNPEITVVIPMYNCEAFVNEVLSMFSKQSFTEFEVICVIDGATDNTENIVSEFCKNDPRFRYIVRENGGPGSARNTGLFIAKGRYIIFADAYDEYSEDYLKKLYETAIMNNAQIVICKMFQEDNILNTKTVRGFDEKKFHENILYSHYCIDDLYESFQPWVYNKIYNTNFIKDNEIIFSETRASEDAFFFYTALSVAERIFVLDDPILTYRLFINPGSLTGKRICFQHEAVEVLRLFYQWLVERDLFDIHMEDYLGRVKKVLDYNGGFAASPRYISEISHFLNKEEPCASMTTEMLLFYFKDCIDTKKDSEIVKKFETCISDQLLQADPELSFKYECSRNKIHTAELLRKVSMERYGRNFENILKVSVIIPVFNPGTGIIRCIDSLRNQTLHEIEILIIDDCSTDDSMDKVRKVATEDKRIHILKNEKNMGPGYSRNKGIEMAQGEYLSFVDPDDYVALDFLKLLYMKAKNEKTDIVKGLTICEKKDGSPLWERPMANQFLRDKLAKGVPLYAAFTRGHQNTIYRRSYILSKNVRYSLDYRAEDVVFLLQCCSRTNSITFSDEAFYYYCERYNSITHSTGSKELRYYFDSFHKLVEYAMQYLPENEYTKEYIQTLFLSAIRELYRYTDIQEMEKEVIYGLAYLREEWNRLPHHDEWGREFFSLYANQVYNRLLPMQPYFSAWEGARPPVRYALLLKRWVDFYIDMPQERKAVSKDLQKLIIKSIDAVSDSNKDYSTEEKKYGKAILVEQIKRLPLDMQSKIEDVRIKYHDWFYPKKLPKTIRIDASTHCQLCCAGCGIQKNNAFGLGKGFLKFENFKRFLDDNPQIERVELSNNGEIFLNPDLIKIMEYSYQKGVALEADMGTNFNTVSDEQLQALVDYEFRFISFSIDGASQETYSQYRRGGDYDKVIANIKKLINIKTKKGSHYPEMRWQFVPNEFNEGEIEQAKGLAKELGIPIWFKLNYLGNYKPSNPELLKAQTGLSEITRAEYLEKYELPYLNEDCLQVFLIRSLTGMVCFWDAAVPGNMFSSPISSRMDLKRA